MFTINNFTDNFTNDPEDDREFMKIMSQLRISSIREINNIYDRCEDCQIEKNITRVWYEIPREHIILVCALHKRWSSTMCSDYSVPARTVARIHEFLITRRARMKELIDRFDVLVSHLETDDKSHADKDQPAGQEIKYI